MIREVTAKRYAEAAYLLAKETGTEEAWLVGLATMGALFVNPQARAILESARVPLSAKLRLVEDVLAGIDPLVLNLARLLLRRARTSLGPQIVEAFLEMLEEAKGISHAQVTTAVPLSEEDVKAVERKLSQITGRQVTVETRVDESILGGLVARIGDRLIDGSTRSQLLALKRRLQEAQA